MSNIDSDFRTKAAASTGIYHPDGRRVDWGGASRASINTPHDPWGGMTRKLSPSEAAAFNATDDGKEVARQVREMRFKNVTVGKTQTPPPEGMFQRVGPNPNAAEGPKSALGGLRARANAMFGGQATPTDWKGIGKSVAGKAKAGLGKALSNFNTIENAIGAGDDLAMITAAPNADMIEKFGAGAEALGNVAVGGLVDRFNAGRGFITGTGTSVANGATNGRPVTQLSRMFNGRSAIDNIRASNYGETSAPNPFTVVGNTAKSLMNPDPVGVTPSAKAVAPTSTPVATEPAAQQPTLSPWNRSDDLATEAKRQFTNATPIQDGGNGLLAQAEAGLSRARGQYAQGGEGGARAFRDPAVQAAFNARNMLEGTGIAVNTTKDGRTEFSGDNRAGGGKLYRAADGSVTNDWSKTQQYADALQRNAKDQDRLAELTRSAALSGDKEAVARLTHGDQRLAGIAAEAATEAATGKSLRDAVKGGSRYAAMVLADMEKSKATQAYQNVDLGLKRAALVGAQEDRDLNRQLRQDSLNAKVAENQRAAAKDTRETAQARMTTLDKQLEQYATVDGKLDGQKVGRLRGLAANLQPSPGQSPEEFNKDVTTHVGLASKLDGMQAFYDRWFSQAGQGGTDLRQWKPNDSIRGGFVTDQGDHISTGQYNSLTDDEKALFKKLYLKGGK